MKFISWLLEKQEAWRPSSEEVLEAGCQTLGRERFGAQGHVKGKAKELTEQSVATGIASNIDVSC